MNTAEEFNAEVIDFEEARRQRLAPNPTDPNDPIWLRGLDAGTMFLAKRKNTAESALGMFVVEFHTKKSTFMFERTMGQASIPFDTVGFCSQWSLHEVIRTGAEYRAEQELNKKHEAERDSHRTNFDQGLANDAGLAGVNPQDEGC